MFLDQNKKLDVYRNRPYFSIFEDVIYTETVRLTGNP